MTSIQITTPVANCYIDHVSCRTPEQQVTWAKAYFQKRPEMRVVVYDEQGTVVYQAGPQSLVPRIWTHTPVPYGLPIEALQVQFETSALSVLGDDGVMPNLAKEGMDNRYMFDSIRMAWMMYVDLAIKHYTTAV